MEYPPDISLSESLYNGSPRSFLQRLTDSYVRRLRGMAHSADLRVYPQYAQLHSLGQSRQTLAKWWIGRNSRWFLNPQRVKAISSVYKTHELEGALLIRRAENVLSGKMPILAHEPLEFSGPDRWRRDHINGISAAQMHYTEIDPFVPVEVGDIRRVWEINRFPWIYWLGQAHLLSGRNEFAEKFNELFTDWFKQNPYQVGVNYLATDEIAFRVYALVWSLDLFGEYLTRETELLSIILETIWRDCKFMESSLESSFSLEDRAGRSLLLGSFALYAVGSALPEFSEAYPWRQKGEKGLLSFSETEYFSDGVPHDCTSSEFIYATDCYLQAALISAQRGFSLEPKIKNHAYKLIRRLTELAPEDFTLPQFNDCDGGRLTWFCLHPLDIFPALKSALNLFDDKQLRAQLAKSAGRVSAGYDLWMSATEDSSERFTVTNEFPENESNQLRPESGLISFKNKDGDYALFRCVGQKQRLASAHDAPTAFTLKLGGRPVIVDSGTGTFTQNLSVRNQFRSALGRNILLVNGRGPSAEKGISQWERFTEARLQVAKQFEGGYYALARHTGYTQQCGFPVEIERELIMLDEGLTIIVDRWTAEREIEPSLELTIAPEFSVSNWGRMIFEEDGALFHFLIAPQFEIPVAEAEIDSETVGETEPEYARDCRFRPKIEMRPFSPDYGIIGETPNLISVFNRSRSGAVVSLFSRIGPLRHTPDLSVFAVGEEDYQRELHVGASGRVSLEGQKRGKLRDEPIVFAR